MHKKLALIIIIQTIAIVILSWLVIFYGKDEYESYRTEQEEEIEGLNRVSTKQGVNIVSLSPAVQKNSGIVTAKIKEASFNGEIKSFGTVVSIDSLIEAKARFLNLQAEINTLRAAGKQNLKQYQRLKALNADDKNVSDRALQEALATVEADKAKITSNELQIKTLESSMKLQWGEALAKLTLNEKSPDHLQNLLTRKNVLIQVSLPMTTDNPATDSHVSVSPLNETLALIDAIYVSPAAQADSNGFGKTFYYSAPAEQLRIGMRVNVEAESTSGNISNGIIVPSNAVVWYAGKPWAYFKQGKEQFVRKPISTDTEVEAGWFNQGISADAEVVVSGAQLLLSEEFKYLIKNENED